MKFKIVFVRYAVLLASYIFIGCYDAQVPVVSDAACEGSSSTEVTVGQSQLATIYSTKHCSTWLILVKIVLLKGELFWQVYHHLKQLLWVDHR